MSSVVLRPGADLSGFRAALRALVAQAVPPDAVSWASESEPDLFGGGSHPVARPPLQRPCSSRVPSAP